MVKNLNLLSVLHYVYGGLVCLGGVAVLVAFSLGAMVGTELAAEHGDAPPPAFLGPFLQVFGSVLFVVLLGWGLLIALSGRWIANRKNRTGSIIVAALCLLSFPFGTALGVFALVVLSNDEVRREYDAGKALA